MVHSHFVRIAVVCLTRSESQLPADCVEKVENRGVLYFRYRSEILKTAAKIARVERVLDRFAALAHGLRVLIETPLYLFQNLFVLPPGDHPVCALSAACLQRAGSASLRRISPEVETIALPLV